MQNKTIDRINEMLSIDGIDFKDIEISSKILYRMNENPLPTIRRYFKRSGILTPIHYIETSAKMLKDDLFRKLCGRDCPIMAVIATKHEGYVEEVDFIYINDEALSEEDLLFYSNIHVI